MTSHFVMPNNMAINDNKTRRRSQPNPFLFFLLMITALRLRYVVVAVIVDNCIIVVIIGGVFIDVFRRGCRGAGINYRTVVVAVVVVIIFRTANPIIFTQFCWSISAVPAQRRLLLVEEVRDQMLVNRHNLIRNPQHSIRSKIRIYC